MKLRHWLASFVVSLGFAHCASGAELSLYWQGMKGTAEQVIDLTVGNDAVIEVWVTLSDGDTLSGVFFGNESVANVSQTTVSANADIGWTADEQTSPNGESLGDGVQWVGFGGPGAELDGPGEYFIGTQTITLNDAGDGTNAEIAIEVGGMSVFNEGGGLYVVRPTSSPRADNVGSVHIGSGSPGYTATEFGVEYVDEAEPLIIRVTTGGGGGGGGGGIPDNTNDNTSDNTNDNSTDNTNDNTTDPNTNDNTTDGNLNDNSTDNTNDNSVDNTNDNSTDTNTNTNDNSSTDSNTNTNTNSGGGTTSPPSSGGICGVGMVGALPIALIGLLTLQAGCRRRRRA